MHLHEVLIKAIQHESTVIGLLELKASPHYPLCEVVILLFSVQLKWPWSPHELSTLVRTSYRTLTQSQQPALSHYPSYGLEMEMPVTAMSPPLLSLSSLSLKFSHPTATGGRSFSSPLPIWPVFLPGLCRVSALYSLQLSFSISVSLLPLFLSAAAYSPPHPLHPFPRLLRRAKSLKGLFCS